MIDSLRRFIASEAAAGVAIAVAAGLALLASNSPWAPAYQSFVNFTWGEHATVPALLVWPHTLQHWVNDLFMAGFFLLVGLEIKRECLIGQLATRRRAALPAAAALAGMIVPALIYVAINRGDALALRGWAIPTATDIAFALGILMLLGSRVPPSLKIFLTAVAIIDDLGAILVIAIFYTPQLALPWLAVAVVGVLGLIALNRLRVDVVAPYLALGAGVWLAVLQSGIHPTLAGVVTALAIPMSDRSGKPVLEHLEHRLHPGIAYGVLPLFAFVNAGVSLDGVSPQSLVQGVPLGIASGLLLGKTIGVFGGSWLMARGGWAALPEGASHRQFLGVCVLCGIGFTMSLFIGGLGFGGHGAGLETQVKLGVLGGSLLSGLVGSALLLAGGDRRRA